MPEKHATRSGFGSLFGAVEREMAAIEHEMDELLSRVQEAGADLRSRPLLFGWSLHVDEDGSPHIRPFGSLVGSERALLEGWREPLLTYRLEPEEGRVHLMAELPGMKTDDIHVNVGRESVTIQAESEHRRYRASCSLPVRLDPEQSEATYDNGVLTLTVGIQPRADKPHEIEVKAAQPEQTVKSRRKRPDA